MALSPSLRRGTPHAPTTGPVPSHPPSLRGAPAQGERVAEGEGWLLSPNAAALAAPAAPAAPAASRCRDRANSASASSSGADRGRRPMLPPAPNAPPAVVARSAPQPLLSTDARLAADESYGADERALNEFLMLHPMLSFEATSHKTMQLVASVFEKAAVPTADVPVVPKSWDDGYLRPPNAQIGERGCACDKMCLCVLMAKHRHGDENELGFVCTEYLLPTESEAFHSGRGLPKNRKKCLVCTRYFQTYLYWQARTDPNFNMASAVVSMQAFGNVVAAPALEPPDLEHLSASMHDLPINASPVCTLDGYKPEAMLFVDEEFCGSSLAARGGRMATLAWKPVVRFKTRHYRYVRSAERVHIVQVGIGAEDPTGTGLRFAEPAAAGVAPLSA